MTFAHLTFVARQSQLQYIYNVAQLNTKGCLDFIVINQSH